MNKELSKRILTSLYLLIILAFMFYYPFVLIISLAIISLISWVEFNGLITRIFNKKKFNNSFIKLLINFSTLIYLTFFCFLIFNGISNDKNLMIYLISICICSDIGGLLFGKIFKGKKLTRISPNKTISGSLGSFILSLLLVPFFFYFVNEFNIFKLFIVAIVVSFFCQLGDLFISYLKRKAKVKDTGQILPGHGGVLDRIDGILFALPLGMIAWGTLIII